MKVDVCNSSFEMYSDVHGSGRHTDGELADSSCNEQIGIAYQVSSDIETVDLDPSQVCVVCSGQESQ